MRNNLHCSDLVLVVAWFPSSVTPSAFVSFLVFCVLVTVTVIHSHRGKVRKVSYQFLLVPCKALVIDIGALFGQCLRRNSRDKNQWHEC